MLVDGWQLGALECGGVSSTIGFEYFLKRVLGSRHVRANEFKPYSLYNKYGLARLHVYVTIQPASQLFQDQQTFEFFRILGSHPF